MSMNKQEQPIKVALCGACMSGNMGGQALYISMVESLREFLGEIEVTVISKYPVDDAHACREQGWRMVSFATGTQLAFLPVVLLIWLLRSLGIPRSMLAVGPLSPYAENDVLVDLSGISFTDARSLSGLVINSLWLMPAIATGIPLVKASQAMGPFNKLYVNLASRFFLPRAAVLVARGEKSARYLREFLPGRVIHELPDVAFALIPAPDEQVDRILSDNGLEAGKPYCVVGPSLAVDIMVAASGSKRSYAEMMARVVDNLVELSGLPVILVPHERSHHGGSVDDLSVCRKVFEHVNHPETVKILTADYSAAVLKAIIARGEVAVGSRFHFLVAAMSSNVPGLAIAWSHKYYEMMKMVGMEEYVINHLDADDERLKNKVKQLWEERATLRSIIAQCLPAAIGRAKENAKVVAAVVRKLQHMEKRDESRR